MRNIWRELTYFVGFTEFFTNIPRQRVSYAWPREALAVGLGLTVSTSVFTAITGKFTSMIGVAVALLGAAIVWSLCCIAWNTWLAVREEVGVNQPTPPSRRWGVSDTKAALWAIGVFVSAIVFEVVQSVRAERAMYACEAQGLQPRRISFTAEVICVPVVKEVGRE